MWIGRDLDLHHVPVTTLPFVDVAVVILVSVLKVRDHRIVGSEPLAVNSLTEPFRVDPSFEGVCILATNQGCDT